MKMEKKMDVVPPPPPSVGDYEDNQSTYTVDQPPPAYRKPDLPSIKVAKIVAGTILIVTLIAGFTAVAIVYMQHNLKCAQLVADQESSSSELPQAAKIIQDNADAKQAIVASSSEERTTRIPFPIQVDIDENTEKMMEKNPKTRLNCFVEKKKTDTKSSKTASTGNSTGEVMTLTCRSGNDRSGSSSRPKNSKTTTTTTTTEKSPSSPILIRIPLSRGPMFRPQLRLISQQPSPSSPSSSPARRPVNPFDAILQQMSAPSRSQQSLNPIQLLLQGLHQLLPIPVPKELQSDQPENKQDNSNEKQQQQENNRKNNNNPFQMMFQQGPGASSQESPSILRMLNPFQQFRVPMMPFPPNMAGPNPFQPPMLDDMMPQLFDVQKRIQQERRLEEIMEQQQMQRRRELQQQDIFAKQQQSNAERRRAEEQAKRQRHHSAEENSDEEDDDEDDSPSIVTIHELRRPEGGAGPVVPPAESRSLRGRPEGRSLPMREMHPLQRIPMPMPQQMIGAAHHQMAPHVPPMMGPQHVRSEPVFLHPQQLPKELQHPQQQILQPVAPPHPQQQQQLPQQEQRPHPEQQQQQRANHPMLSQEEMAEMHARQHQESINLQQLQQQHQQQQQQQHPNVGGIQIVGSPSFHEMAHLAPGGDIDRSGHLPPFITGSHNMQPRSSARPRNKRSAEACSCVCK